MELDVKALQALIEKDAIREASLRYTRGIDRHDDELLISAYHEGAIDDHGEYIGDPAGFADYANGPEGTHTRNWVGHHHYVTNQTIDLDGDTAHTETYFIAVLKRRDGTCDQVGGRYVDRLEKRDGVWAVAERACLVEWNAAVRPDDGAALDPSIFVQGTWDKSDVSYQRPLKLGRPFRDPRKSK